MNEREQTAGTLSEREIRRRLHAGALGRALEVHACLDSTNNRAKALAREGAPHGLTVIADTQTGGRGRRGRSFFSPEGCGIYLSCVLRLEHLADRAGLLTSLAAVATARAIERVSPAKVFIKWVNDLYIGGKKVCGILCEAVTDPAGGPAACCVVGIGVNVGRMAFPPELRDIASSVANETGVVPDRNRLIAEILNELQATLGDLDTGAFLAESRARSNVLGREVTVIEADRSYRARAVAIDGQGRLVVEGPQGVIALNHGEVSLKLL